STPPPQNHSEFTGGWPAATRRSFHGWVCRTTCASLISVRQRRTAASRAGSVPTRVSNRSLPSASSGSGNDGSAVPSGRRRYQREGSGASIGKPASPNSVRSAGSRASASSRASCRPSATANRRAPLMSGRTQAGSARSQRPPASPGASTPRVSAAAGQPRGSSSKCRCSCARSPGSPGASASARPIARASDGGSDAPTTRRRAGSSRMAAGAIARRRSADVAARDDLVLALPGGRVDGHLVALVLADQRARHRRGDRDHAELDVGLEVANDLVGLFFAGLGVGEHDRGAEHDLVAGVELRHVDDLRVREFALELLDAALDEALLLARGVVLGVLLEVAVRARLGDRLDHRRPLVRLEVVEFGAQALRALGGQWCLHVVPVGFQPPAPGCPAPACPVPAWSSCSDHTGPLSRKSRECSSALAPATVVEYVTRAWSASRRIENESAMACRPSVVLTM